MTFLIADTFSDSLARLSGEEQKAVKQTAFDLQMDPSSPGMQFHRLEKSRDPHFWSIRAGSDVRLIVHRTEAGTLLCYVGHHDDAYRWAERRRIETHPKTGAAQIVELRETVLEIQVPKYVEVDAAAPVLPHLFAHLSDDELLGYGVPTDWLNDVRIANEDTILDIGVHLPAEASEALLAIAVGGTPSPFHPSPLTLPASPFEHPDARRRFRIMANTEELSRALDYPWDKWTVFLHPEQRSLVERDYSGPARVSGSAGTGKTIVALHRAVHVARSNPESRVLLTTFSETLAHALRGKLKRLLSTEPRLTQQIEVYSLNAIGERLYERQIGRPKFADRATIAALLQESSDQILAEPLSAETIKPPSPSEGRASGRGGRVPACGWRGEVSPPESGAGGRIGGRAKPFSQRFLLSEWEEIVDAWQIASWEQYRDVARLGRKTRLRENQRADLWRIFEGVLAAMQARGLITKAGMFARLAARFAHSANRPFDFAIVDEAQDIGIAQLGFLAALIADKPNGLFFAGDLGQRIFQLPFSWKSLGVDVRGRSRTLHVNYRTSHQIRTSADRLLAPEVSDVDGNVERRGGAVSLFNGPPPAIQVFDDAEAETGGVGAWLRGRSEEGAEPHEIGVFVRSEAQLDRAIAAIAAAGLSFRILDDSVDTLTGAVAVSTMHLAKGLEFRAVAVMACDDEVIPLRERIETAVESSDLEEVYNTERHLLYVACTRARDHLLVTAVDPASEFLADLGC